MNIINMLAKRLEAVPLESKDKKEEGRIYFHPSFAMATSFNGKPLGTCMRQTFFEKTGVTPSNPRSLYNLMVFESGHVWEGWVRDMYKRLGIYVDSSVKLVDNSLSISCEIDILHTNPELNTLEVTEVKSYAGNNYYALREILGSDTIPPKPKDQNLLQCVCYLLVLKRYNINVVNLLYIDRSVSSFYNNKQFRVFLRGDCVYYQTLYKGEWLEVKETRFVASDILEKWQVLSQMLELGVVPDREFCPQYTPAVLAQRYEEGLVSKTNYNKAQKGEIMVSDMADYQCTYCPFGKNKETGESVCLSWR